MQSFLLALLTAACWGVGGYFEKMVFHAGNLSPQLGAFLRTIVAVVVLGLASGPELRQLATAGSRSLLAIGIGGGLNGFWVQGQAGGDGVSLWPCSR